MTSLVKYKEIIQRLSKQINQEIPLEQDFPTEKEIYYVASENNIITLSLVGMHLDELPKEIASLNEL